MKRLGKAECSLMAQASLDDPLGEVLGDIVGCKPRLRLNNRTNGREVSQDPILITRVIMDERGEKSERHSRISAGSAPMCFASSAAVTGPSALERYLNRPTLNPNLMAAVCRF